MSLPRGILSGEDGSMFPRQFVLAGCRGELDSDDYGFAIGQLECLFDAFELRQLDPDDA